MTTPFNFLLYLLDKLTIPVIIVAVLLLLIGAKFIFDVLRSSASSAGQNLRLLLVGAVFCVAGAAPLLLLTFPGLNPNRATLDISIIYAPEEDSYMQKAIADFNESYAQGINPLTGRKLAKEETPIRVSGKTGSSGTVAQAIARAYQFGAGNANTESPTIFSPSVSHWLALANAQAGAQVFDLEAAKPTALAPVVIAIWESRLNVLKRLYPNQDLGWQELIGLFDSGWPSGSIGRNAIYYGHTDPSVSSTALSTLVSEFYASAQNLGLASDGRLTYDLVNNLDVQEGVRQIEGLVRHYFPRTTEFTAYIARGPSYIDFVALEENDVIAINQGKRGSRPPEQLVALYPREGTFIHEHPFAIPQAPWVNEEQRQAALVFTDYILSETVQKEVLANGLRPANPRVALGEPISQRWGVNPQEPKKILQQPEGITLEAVRQNWRLLKKSADVFLVIDTSGSMQGEKLSAAKLAAKAFLESLENANAANRVGLISFNDGVTLEHPLSAFEGNRARLTEEIDLMVADGKTSLYDAILATYDQFNQDDDAADRIRAIVVLSDGEDTASTYGDINSVINTLRRSQQQDKHPVNLMPIAYGDDAAVSVLESIAQASSTQVYSGSAEEQSIQKILEGIGSLF
ncbi:MAG: VWA domain-containing protein [Deinococcales bacterium]